MSFLLKKRKYVMSLGLSFLMAVSAVYLPAQADQKELPLHLVHRKLASEQGDSYMEKLEKYRKTLKMQVHQVFIPMVNEFSNITPDVKKSTIDTAKKFSDVIDLRLGQFGQDYEARFINYNRNEDIKNRLLIGESDIKWATEISMNAMIDILNSLEQEKNPKKLEKIINEKLAVIKENTTSIELGKEIFPSLDETIKKVTPVKTGLIRTICSAVTRMCINQDLTKIIREIPTRPFMRYADQKAEIVFVDQHGREVPKASLPADAAVIIGMNHDHASLDGMYLQEVAKLLGVDRNVILTTKDAWPHITALSKIGVTHKDQNILFKQDKDTKSKVLEIFKAQRKGRVAFSIFPEGELPFWHTQFPLFANFGAFSIARNAAHELKDTKSVYYVEVMSNFLRSTTSKDSTPIRIEITLPELVPTTPVGPRDAWVEEKRIAFEKRANSPERRGLMVDMVQRQKISADGRAYVVDEVRPYKVNSQNVQPAQGQNKVNGQAGRCERVFLAM